MYLFRMIGNIFCVVQLKNLILDDEELKAHVEDELDGSNRISLPDEIPVMYCCHLCMYCNPKYVIMPLSELIRLER